MQYPNKYHLTKGQSFFLARKNWDTNVYCGMRMEDRAVTLPQLRAILASDSVPSVLPEDVQAVQNMRDAWYYLLENFDRPITMYGWCWLNRLVARNEALDWGHLRTGAVTISGTDYSPPIPEPERTEAELDGILDDEASSATERALAAFCWGTRGQFFWDGNKRTSLLLANSILLQAGAGMLTIRDEHMERFNEALRNFYNSGDAEPLKRFLYDSAIAAPGFEQGDPEITFIDDDETERGNYLQQVYTVEQLRRLMAPIAQKHGVRRLSIFGSYARGEADEDSDVDICVDAPELQSLFTLGALYTDLKDALGKEIDLVTECGLAEHMNDPFHRRFEKNLRKDALVLYDTDSQ